MSGHTSGSRSGSTTPVCRLFLVRNENWRLTVIGGFPVYPCGVKTRHLVGYLQRSVSVEERVVSECDGNEIREYGDSFHLKEIVADFVRVTFIVFLCGGLG